MISRFLHKLQRDTLTSKPTSQHNHLLVRHTNNHHGRRIESRIVWPAHLGAHMLPYCARDPRFVPEEGQRRRRSEGWQDSLWYCYRVYQYRFLHNLHCTLHLCVHGVPGRLYPLGDVAGGVLPSGDSMYVAP